MINILLSVRQPFSEKILSREKEWELRKNVPRLKKGNSVTLWLYESGKDGKRAIIGRCLLNMTIEILPDPLIIELTMENACVTREHLRDYLPCYAWGVHAPVRLSAAVPLSAIGLTRPPQSWRYITNNQAAILKRRFA